MPPKVKRPYEVIDLTGDAPRPTRPISDASNKRIALGLQHSPHVGRPQSTTPVPLPVQYRALGTGGTSVYSNASSGVASSSSSAAHLPSTQSSQQVSVVEPDVLDLTQDDEEPARELYGSFGASTTA